MSATTPTAETTQSPSGELWVSRAEAAALCDVHVDTIRRHITSQKLPRTRKNPKGVVEVPVADLVAAGLLDPMAAGDSAGEVATRSRAERDLVATRQELAVTATKLDAAVARAERAEAEVAFLRTWITANGRAA